TNASYRWTTRGSANFSAAARALRLIDARRGGSLSTSASARANGSGAWSSTSRPVLPDSTISRVPGDEVATTGAPHAIASTSTFPNPSYRDVSANTSARAMYFQGFV